MTLTAPRYAPLPREALDDRLRRWLSPVLALLADMRHYLLAPLPPLPPITVRYGMGTVPVTCGAPWETKTAEQPALTDERIAAIKAGAA